MCCVVFDLKMNQNQIAQAAEIQQLHCMYGLYMQCITSETYSIKLAAYNKKLVLYATMPPEYPAAAPPQFDISAPWMHKTDKLMLHRAIDEIYLQHFGETIISRSVEAVRDIFSKMISSDHIKELYAENSTGTNVVKRKTKCPQIIHGEQIILRHKSCFQAHAAIVHSIAEVHAVIHNLKITTANQILYAYRFEKHNKRGVSVYEEAYDDGEHCESGQKMLRVLQMLNHQSTLVAVSRRYGGALPTSERYLLINTACRKAIELSHRMMRS